MLSRPKFAANLLELIDNEGAELSSTQLTEALAAIEALKEFNILEEKERQIWQKFNQVSGKKMEVKESSSGDNAMDFSMDDVFYFVCKHNHIKLVTPLIEAKVSINGTCEEIKEVKHPPSYGKTFRGTEAEKITRKWERRQYYGDVIYNDDDKGKWQYKSPFLVACERGHLEIVTKLFEAKASIDSKGISHALTSAASAGHLAIVELLIEKKAPISALTKALDYATFQNQVAIVDLLIKNNASIPIKEENFLTEALKERVKKEIIYKLIEHKAGFDDQINRALVYASGEGYLDIVTRLIEEKASLNYAEQYYRTESDISGDLTALDAASYYGHTAIVNKLLDMNAEINNNTLTCAAAGGHLSLVNRLLAEGANPNNGVEIEEKEVEEEKEVKEVKKISSTALVEAVRNDHLDIVKRLIQAKVNVNSVTPSPYDRVTAFGLACRNMNREVINLLIEANADVGLNCSGPRAISMLFTSKDKYGRLSVKEYKERLCVSTLLLSRMSEFQYFELRDLHNVIFILDPSDCDLLLFLNQLQRLELFKNALTRNYDKYSKDPNQLMNIQTYHQLLKQANDVGSLSDDFAPGIQLPKSIMRLIKDYDLPVERVIRATEVEDDDFVYFCRSESSFNQRKSIYYDKFLARFSKELSLFKPGNENQQTEQKAVTSTKQNP